MDKIAFVGGQLCPETFPVDGLIQSAKASLEKHGKNLISYPFQVNMHEKLIRICAERYEHKEKESVPSDEIMITTGSKQAIWGVMEQFTKPGDIILSEDMTYVGTIGMFNVYDRIIEGVPMDEEGMRVDILEEKVRRLAAQGKKPSLIYTIPSHQNPTGVIMNLQRRKKIIDLALEYGIPVIEDDCYGDVIFDDKPIPPSLYTLSKSSLIFYLGSYSKILGPGIRLGYLMARQPHFAPIARRKDITDGGTSALSSMIVAEYLDGRLYEHIHANNAMIKKKQDLVCACLRAKLAGVDVSWNQPRGGIFLWVRLPENINLALLEKLAEERGVGYTPGRDFSVTNKDLRYLRLSYAHLSLEDIEEGAARLAGCIRGAVQ